MKKNDNMIVKALVLVVTVMILGISTTYAYFAVNISGVETESTIKVGGATISATYAAGSNTITGTNVIPGWSADKTFSINATTSKAIDININLVIDSSNFQTTAGNTNSYLQYQLFSCTDATCASTTALDTNPVTIDKTSGSIKLYTWTTPATGGTSYYKFVLLFPNTTGVQPQTGTGGALQFGGHITIDSSSQITQ